MNRRTFLKLSGTATAGTVLRPAEGWVVIVLYIAAGATIAGTGAYMAWKISECYKNHFPGTNAPPPPPPPNGSRGVPPTKPGTTNSPASKIGKKKAGEYNSMAAVDMSEQGCMLSDSEPCLYYVESSVSKFESTKPPIFELWIGPVYAILRYDHDDTRIEWCPDKNNICVDFTK